jgi:TP901 family phage tail tape measure protein
MERFARSANKAAKEIGVSTKAYADASLIYYQQGLNDTEAQERGRITSIASNITGQSTSEVSEQLTAIWNGYKVDAAEAELYIDKVAKVAAQTGADLEELATGMSKVASAANVMGVDVDQLNAQLATVITVTRQAPESVGTAFKTIYSRINAIETGSKDAETSLKQYTADMKKYGFSVLDANGKLRDTGEIIEEIGGKWEKLTKE